ncbi:MULTISPECIES: hypothetical protein [Burkholderia cepacia complex]|uniref:hypothetical protein n=1 Tax=Burkholderia cepacia complex TaxID=87882 RepID=UPI000B6FE174|nr:hypothetical protein [Burkholderia metallica]OUE39788.1 hypothetical protein BZY94_29520 [Burkholderia territorii]HDR9504448.1 hypothetical protein [Burkholderia cepacia]
MNATTGSDGDTLEALIRIVATNGEALSRFGGWLAVLYKFVDAALPQFTASQRADVARLLRQGIENIMSITDDVEMPAEYHTALLDQANILLAALEGRPGHSKASPTSWRK